MQPNLLRKYLLDIEQMITEIEYLKNQFSGNFNKFNSDWIAIRAVERQLQIIGEAMNSILKIDSSIKISSARNIVDLRNLIVHSYDSIDNAMLWAIIQRDIPNLKMEILRLTD